MPVSAVNTPGSDPSGYKLALGAQILYLTNLMLLPGLAFVWLTLLYLRADPQTPPLARAHLEQTFFASLWAGVLLVLVNLLIILLGGYDAPWTWVIVIIYFTICHSSLILLGMLGLAKAMAGQCVRFPLVGRPLPPGCKDLSP